MKIKRKIRMILKASKNILGSPLLTEIKKESNVARMVTRPTSKIKTTLALVENNLKRSKNTQTPYLQLITWIRWYIDFNINQYHDLANFTFKNLKDFDKMFELWVLFEMVSYIKQTYATRIKPLIEEDRPKGFKFEIKNQIFTLRYEKCYEVPIGNPVSPDYTIEADEQCCCGNTVTVSFDDSEVPNCECGDFRPKVVLIMDAKNWRGQNRMDGVRKMAWYMVQLNEYGPKTGILFFSNYEQYHDKKNPQTDHWDQVKVNQGNWEFIVYVVKSSKKLEYIEQLGAVFGQIFFKLFSPQ